MIKYKNYFVILFFVFATFGQSIPTLNYSSPQTNSNYSQTNGNSPQTNSSSPQTNSSSPQIGAVQLDQNQLGSYLPNSSDVQDVVLDNVIDSLTYKIGPGDAFLIYIWDADKKQLQAIVNTEGFVFLPMIGITDLKALNLTEAKKKIKDKINEVYKNTQVTILLTHLRSFKTYVYGEVNRKGSYIVNGNTRISDIISKAGGITKGKHRGIIIYNEFSRTTSYADLTLAENVSDFQKNPYISEGDRIFVPPQKEVVYINGNVSYPGTYDYQENDHISELIKLAGGFSRGADSNKILVYQYLDNGDSLKCTQMKISDIDTFKINPDDRIIVSAIPNFRLNRTVSIRGEVNNPGEYPIRKDKTSLLDIITMSGGLRESADLNVGKIIRNRYQFPGEKEYNKLKKTPQILQSPEEQKYFLTKYTEDEITLNLDFKDILKNDKKMSDVILESGDVIVIPERTTSVKVIGGIMHPGLVTFVKNKDYQYYINQSGGFNFNAKRKYIRVIKSGSEKTLLPNRTNIEPGDVIYIPEKMYVKKTDVAKEWIVIVGSITTTLLAIFAIQDRFN